MKKIVLVVLVALVGFVAQAQEKKKNKNAKHVTRSKRELWAVSKTYSKGALSVEGVKSATWDIPSHQLSLILNEEKCSLLDVKKAIAKVGHDTDEVKATKEDYDKLHSCCLYEKRIIF